MLPEKNAEPRTGIPAPHRQKILIADDSEINRAILADMLADEYALLEAEDGERAVELMGENRDIDLVLLDIMMPKMDGFEVLAVMNRQGWIEDMPVIMISAERDAACVNRAYTLGVTDYISRPFDEMIVRRRVVNTLILYAKQKKLIQMVTDQIYEKEKQSHLMVNILSHIVEFRNGESGLHVLHIYALTEMLLMSLVQKTGKYNLTYAEISLISTASALHDIGKITVPDNILNKPGKLTPEEFEEMKKHTTMGASMLQSLPFYTDELIVKTSYEICRWHHERYDGRGYPDGLKGEDIPVSAQIVALADVYDALTSERVYKTALSHGEAVKMILNGDCGAFNPLLLECFIDIADSLQGRLSDNPWQISHQMELRDISAELFRHTELSASERTLRLIERERTKYRFLALVSHEIQFEYIEATHTVIFSDWSAGQLGLTQTTVDPYRSTELQLIVGAGNLVKLNRLLRHTTPDSPEIRQELKLLIHGERRRYQCICRASWLPENTLQYLGAVGKVIDIS